MCALLVNASIMSENVEQRRSLMLCTVQLSALAPIPSAWSSINGLNRVLACAGHAQFDRTAVVLYVIMEKWVKLLLLDTSILGRI